MLGGLIKKINYTSNEGTGVTTKRHLVWKSHLKPHKTNIELSFAVCLLSETSIQQPSSRLDFVTEVEMTQFVWGLDKQYSCDCLI